LTGERPPKSSHCSFSTRLDRGIKTHIALSAPDFDATLARLEAAHVPFGEMPGRPGKVTTRADGVRRCFVRDPDGHWIEINDVKAHG
jgi:catechol 2,3-dioxygenase-like lactoylglutathione lyase family enzyme